MADKIRVALVDDHILIRHGLSSLVNSFEDAVVVLEANHGKDFMEKCSDVAIDVVLMDINMPEMDGYDTTLWLKQHRPEISVLALSMYDNESAIIRMFRAGARGYILKDCEPQELDAAIHAIVKKGYYYTDTITGRLIHSINTWDDDDHEAKNLMDLTEREIMFLKLACTELTYKEIADKMSLSPRTIDGYRDALFDKLNVKTRVGLVMYAVKNSIVCP